MAKSLSTIRSEMCESGIGRMTSPVSLLQAIGQLYDGVSLNPPEPPDPENLLVLPLTYDSDDYSGLMTWTNQGNGQNVTPDGFEGNGWNSRLSSTIIPSWMSSSATTSLFSSVQIYPTRPGQASGDAIVFAGDNAAGITPAARLGLRAIQDPLNSTTPYLAFESYAGGQYTSALCRPCWKYQRRFPLLTSGGFEARPQAILFLDANTVVITAHYEDQFSLAYKVNLTDMSVIGSFSFGSTFKHIASMAVNAAGDVWCVDYATDHTIKIDLDASFTAGTVVITADYDTSALTGVSGITFITITGTEYVLIAEYATSGSPYLYVIASSKMIDGAVFVVTDRYKRFLTGLRSQGVTIDASGNLWMSRNRGGPTGIAVTGWIERFGVASTLITSTADNGTLTYAYTTLGPSQYVEDFKFHPTTGDMWMQTEGWASVGDIDGFLSLWSWETDDSPQLINVELYLESGTIQVKLNNMEFGSYSVAASQAIEVVSIGAPPQPTQSFANGYFKGFVKNVRIQEAQLTDVQYNLTISGYYEPSSLSVYQITLVNPGAEAGSATGWTNETGSLAVRSVNPTPYAGSYYFSGGSNAQTISRQRVDLLTATGLTGAQVDAGNIWVKARWAQASFTDQDPCTLGVRLLNSTPTQISLTYGLLNFVPWGNSGVTPNWQNLANAVTIVSGTRYIDAVYRADRTDGTNNDGYIDVIQLTVYRQ